MAQELVARGDRCFVEEEYEGATQAYSEALKLEPSNARVLEARASAHIKLEQYQEANADATKALELDPQLAKAYLRKGVALFHMEEYEAAKEAFEAGQSISNESTFKTWIRKCDAELEDELEASKSKQARAGPNITSPSQTKAAPAPNTPAPPTAAPAPEPAAAPSTSPASAPLAPAAPAVVGPKYRHAHYQIQDKVSVDIYAKKLKKEQVLCQFQEQHLTVTINDLEGQEEYKLDVELYGKVVPERCRAEVLSTKVEINLVKADNTAWPSLEKSDKVAAANYSTPGTEAPLQYPTSYRKQTKDWDKVEEELKELETKGELDSGDPLNNFFKKIFSQGDEDTRRAMQKSFIESNGTVLSTNWSEVGQKKVECTPPEGMTVNKWEQ